MVKELIDSCKSALFNSSYPVFHYDENNQVGKDFSERLANAFEELFSKGFKNVIAVGNDSPNLDEISFDEVVSCLDSGKVVIGPTQKGGTYLLAIPKEVYDRKEFLTIPWKTSAVYGSLKSVYQNAVFLKERIEVHQYYDLSNLFKSELSRQFLDKISILLSEFKFSITEIFQVYSPYISGVSDTRGSPQTH
nr:DUF2064 domain-containing protein [Marinigracilibium pacificum]